MSMSVAGKAPNQQFVEAVKSVYCHVADWFLGGYHSFAYSDPYPSGCEELLNPSLVEDDLEPLPPPPVWMTQVSAERLNVIASFLGIKSWDMVDRAANGDIFLDPTDERKIPYTASTSWGEDVVWGGFTREGARQTVRLWGCGGAPSIREYYGWDNSWPPEAPISDDQIAIVKGALLVLAGQSPETSVDEEYGPLIRDLALLLS